MASLRVAGNVTLDMECSNRYIATMRWLMLLATLPPTPTRHRVGVWRTRQRMGAVRLRGSAWILAENPETTELFQWLDVGAEDVTAFPTENRRASNEKDYDDRAGISRGVLLCGPAGLGAAPRRQGARGARQRAEGRQDVAPARRDGEREGGQAHLREVRGRARHAAAIGLHDEG